jgi:hypothetical protein
MTPLVATDVLCTLMIPRTLAACFATPADVKAHLLQYGIWPERVQQERWRLDAQHYIVDLEVSVPYPQSAGGTP